jgi:hypothetical protein
MEEGFKKVVDFIGRNITWIAGLFLALYMIGFQKEYINALIQAGGVIFFLTGVSGVILYAFTSIKFSKKLAEGDNGKLDPTERYAIVGLAGKIFQGITIAGAALWAIFYLSQFSGR